MFGRKSDVFVKMKSRHLRPVDSLGVKQGVQNLDLARGAREHDRCLTVPLDYCSQGFRPGVRGGGGHLLRMIKDFDLHQSLRSIRGGAHAG